MKFQKAFFAVVVLGVALLLSGHCGWAGSPAYLELEGANQGAIQGSCDIEGREGTIVVYSLGHNGPFPPLDLAGSLNYALIYSLELQIGG